MRSISAFLTDYAVVDRIIDHLKLTFVAEKPPPPQIAYQEVRSKSRLNIFRDFLLPSSHPCSPSRH
jgi:hypothetical protein